MFCKITRSKVSPENLEKLSYWVKEKWAPLISKQQGFKGAYLAKKDNGEFVVLMFWEKAKQVQAWTDNPQHKDIVPEFMSLTTGPVDMDLYEIAYQIEE